MDYCVRVQRGVLKRILYQRSAFNAATHAAVTVAFRLSLNKGTELVKHF